MKKILASKDGTLQALEAKFGTQCSEFSDGTTLIVRMAETFGLNASDKKEAIRLYKSLKKDPSNLVFDKNVTESFKDNVRIKWIVGKALSLQKNWGAYSAIQRMWIGEALTGISSRPTSRTEIEDYLKLKQKPFANLKAQAPTVQSLARDLQSLAPAPHNLIWNDDVIRREFVSGVTRGDIQYRLDVASNSMVMKSGKQTHIMSLNDVTVGGARPERVQLLEKWHKDPTIVPAIEEYSQGPELGIRVNSSLSQYEVTAEGVREKSLEEMVQTPEQMILTCWPDARNWGANDLDAYTKGVKKTLETLVSLSAPGEIISIALPTAFLPQGSNNAAFKKACLETIRLFSESSKNPFLIHNCNPDAIYGQDDATKKLFLESQNCILAPTGSEMIHNGEGLKKLGFGVVRMMTGNPVMHVGAHAMQYGVVNAMEETYALCAPAYVVQFAVGINPAIIAGVKK